MKKMNLGTDKEMSIVLKLAVPAMLAQLINVLYSIVDRLYISNMPGGGEFALAGLGIVAPICTLITSFSFLIGLGGAPLMSIRLGEKNQKKAEDILSNAFLALLVLGIVIPLLVLAFYEPLLTTFGASENTFGFARDYLLIYLIGAPFSIISLGLNQYIISQGYATKGMATMVIGAVINIILDPIFIFGCNMGVQGAALATVIAQVCSFLFTLFVLLSKQSQVRIRLGGYQMKTIKRIMLLGLSPFVIAATDSVVCIILNTCIKNYGGALADDYITVATITTSFFQVFTMPLLGISSGTGAILSYNYGARDVKRVAKAERCILTLALIFTTSSFILSFFLPGPFISLFTSNEQVTEITQKMIRIFMSGIILLSFQYCFVDGLTALGRAKEAVTLSLIRKILTIGLTFLLPLWIGIEGCFVAELVSDIVSSTITLCTFVIIFKIILARRTQEQIFEENTLKSEAV